MVAATIALEATFDGTNFDPCTDARATEGIRLSRGIQGTSPTDRVASTGTMDFRLDNSEGNSGITLGYYSPDHASKRESWDVGTQVRLSLTYGGTAYYKFLGKVAAVNPDAGIYGPRGVNVTAVDYMDELATHNLRLIPTQTNKQAGELLDTVIDNMSVAPFAMDLSTNCDTYLHGLHVEKDEQTTGMTAAQKIAQSELGDIYIKPLSTPGGYMPTLVFRSRHDRMDQTTVEVAFSDNMTGLVVNRAKENIYTHIKVTTHPLQRDTAPVILYSLAKAITLSPGQVYTFTARYTDPLSDGRRVSGEDMITPVAGTDYIMTGASVTTTYNGVPVTQIGELNSSLGVSVTFGANSAEVTLTNNASVTGCVPMFNLRGYGLYEYDQAEATWEGSAGNRTLYGDTLLNYDLPYQENPHHGEDFLSHFAADNASLKSTIESVEFIANVSDAMMTAALTLDVGSRISVAETVTGITGEYFVNGYSLSIEAGGLIRCTLGPLVRAETTVYFKVGDTLTAADSIIGY